MTCADGYAAERRSGCGAEPVMLEGVPAGTCQVSVFHTDPAGDTMPGCEGTATEEVHIAAGETVAVVTYGCSPIHAPPDAGIDEGDAR